MIINRVCICIFVNCSCRVFIYLFVYQVHDQGFLFRNTPLSNLEPQNSLIFTIISFNQLCLIQQISVTQAIYCKPIFYSRKLC